MRRADRLFEIIQLMRRQRLVRARDLAEKLEVSERTIYRDVRDLMASRVPIEGEAGVGYALRQGFDLPPLMFDEHEIEALVLGARIIESWTDAKLAEAAGNVIAKVEAVIPERLRQHMADTALLAPSRHFAEPVTVDPGELRRALRRRLKVHFHYRDSDDRPTARAVRPLALFFYGPVWLLAGWCELRQDFRSFRLDRMSELAVLDERFRPERGKTIQDFLKQGRPVRHPLAARRLSSQHPGGAPGSAAGRPRCRTRRSGSRSRCGSAGGPPRDRRGSRGHVQVVRLVAQRELGAARPAEQALGRGRGAIAAGSPGSRRRPRWRRSAGRPAARRPRAGTSGSGSSRRCAARR